MRDREKGESKGYGFAVFADKAVTESAIVGLNGLSIDGRVLTCRKCASPLLLTTLSLPWTLQCTMRPGHTCPVRQWRFFFMSAALGHLRILRMSAGLRGMLLQHGKLGNV